MNQLCIFFISSFFLSLCSFFLCLLFSSVCLCQLFYRSLLFAVFLCVCFCSKRKSIPLCLLFSSVCLCLLNRFVFQEDLLQGNEIAAAKKKRLSWSWHFPFFAKMWQKYVFLKINNIKILNIVMLKHYARTIVFFLHFLVMNWLCCAKSIDSFLIIFLSWRHWIFGQSKVNYSKNIVVYAYSRMKTNNFFSRTNIFFLLNFHLHTL
jgi:hypothetical protein